MKMKTKQKVELLGILCLATLLAAPAPIAGQEQTDERPPHACWRGRPLPACAGFFLVEGQVSLPLYSGTRAVTFSQGSSFRQETFETRMDWNLGYMVNVAPEWAVGGMLTMGLHAPGPLTGISARVRRWLRDDVSVEVGAGALRTHGNSAPREELWGGTADARINLADRGSFFVRWDGVGVPASGSSSIGAEPGSFQQAFYVGAAAGSTWAVVGSALAWTFIGIWAATANFQ